MSAKTTFSRQLSLGENVLTSLFSTDGATAAFVLLDGTAILLNCESGEERRQTLHPAGVSLSACVDADGEGFLSAGDDGRVVRFVWGDEPQELASHKGKWIDHVAASAAGSYRAYSVGKEVFVMGREKPLPQASSVGGLAFSPNGKRLAVGHYNGVSLWWTSAKDSIPQTLLWKGSHLGVRWHPTGDYLMTTMQEPALHGWRMKDMGELRMAGYPGKVHSFEFSARGKWLVTSGADQIICWPFTGSGPQGKPPMALGIPEHAPCTVVAPHPKDDMTAAGFASGRIILALFEDRVPVELLMPNGTPVVALRWSADGRRLISAHEDGSAHYYTTESIIAATQ